MSITQIIGLILGLLAYSVLTVLMFLVICLNISHQQYKHKCQELESELKKYKEQSNENNN